MQTKCFVMSCFCISRVNLTGQSSNVNLLLDVNAHVLFFFLILGLWMKYQSKWNVQKLFVNGMYFATTSVQQGFKLNVPSLVSQIDIQSSSEISNNTSLDISWRKYDLCVSFLQSIMLCRVSYVMPTASAFSAMLKISLHYRTCIPAIFLKKI